MLISILIIVGILMIAGAVLGLMYLPAGNANATLNQLESFFGKANSNNTRFTNRKELTVATTHAELITQLNNVGSQLVARINVEREATLANERLMNANFDYLLERERIDEDQKAYVALSQNQVAVAKMASDYGTTPEIMGQVILEKAKMETVLQQKREELELEVERKRKLDEVDVDTHKKKKQFDIDAAHQYEMKDYKTIETLQRKLSKLYQEQEDIENDADISEWRKKKELQRVEKQIEALEKDVERRQGLL